MASGLGLSVHRVTSPPSLNDSCAHAQVPIMYVLSNWMIHVSGTDVITPNVIRPIITLCTLCQVKHERGLELLQERLQIILPGLICVLTDMTSCTDTSLADCIGGCLRNCQTCLNIHCLCTVLFFNYRHTQSHTSPAQVWYACTLTH